MRCPGCYLPMRYEFMCEWHCCDLCGTVTTGEALFYRSRLRRFLDRVTGMES